MFFGVEDEKVEKGTEEGEKRACRWSPLLCVEIERG